MEARWVKKHSGRTLLYASREGREAEVPVAITAREAGYDFSTTADADLDLSATDILWVQGNINWFPRLRRSLKQSNHPLVVVWHTEPLPFPKAANIPQPGLSVRELAKIFLRDSRATDAYTNSRRLKSVSSALSRRLIVVSTAARHEYLQEQGIQSVHVPLGYHPPLGRDLGDQRDIDVLFIGTSHSPRHRRAVRSLERSGVRIVSRGAWDEKGAWGEDRTRLINRAKIFLNLQRHEFEHSGHRFILGMANGALVMSEPVYKPLPFVDGSHFVTATLEDMPAAIERYLNDDDARTRIARAGNHFVQTEVTMQNSLDRIFALIDEKLTA